MMVFVYHHGLLNSGWAGVDVFFVLSGFLITNILRRTRHDAFFWREFWIKRATRILPPYLLVILLLVLFAVPLSLQQFVAYSLSLGDVMAYLRPTFESLRPLWSLAVEEHFYLLWPFAVRRLSRRSLLTLLCAILFIEPLLRAVAWQSTHDWQFLYFLTPFRLDGLSLGSLLAILFESPATTRRLTRWSGLGMISLAACWAVLRLTLGDRFTRGHSGMTYSAVCYSLVALIAACALAYIVSHPQSPASRILALRPLVFVGTISYGAYLYQVPLRDALLHAAPGMGRLVMPVNAVMTIALSALSFYGYERPVVAWGRRRTSALRAPAMSAAVLQK
jgi:peptidoglycan/LPS O-acetylase OafA/YrhL